MLSALNTTQSSINTKNTDIREPPPSTTSPPSSPLPRRLRPCRPPPRRPCRPPPRRPLHPTAKTSPAAHRRDDPCIPPPRRPLQSTAATTPAAHCREDLCRPPPRRPLPPITAWPGRCTAAHLDHNRPSRPRERGWLERRSNEWQLALKF